MQKLIVKEIEVNIMKIENEDYICITDMLRAKDGDFFVTDWLRNRNTLEYIGTWESIYNPKFDFDEFMKITSKAGLHNFKISVKEFIQRTNAISITAKAGRYGGTYAHKDIAFEFAMWISPKFKIYMVKEFQRLKKEEQETIGWSAKRELAKINYRIHTEAIKNNLIPPQIDSKKITTVYADEADVLNVALFGKTAKQWKDENPNAKGNMRDYANVNELICLSNLENINAVLISEKISQSERIVKLNQIAINQISVLQSVDSKKYLK